MLKYFDMISDPETVLEINVFPKISQPAASLTLRHPAMNPIDKFEISLTFHRISNSAANRDLSIRMSFLTLKSLEDFSPFIYRFGIDSQGKLRLNASQIWSIENKGDYNRNAGCFNLKLKLNSRFAEITINETFSSRFEFINDSGAFQIDEIKFEDVNNENSSFLIYELIINRFHYDFSGPKKSLTVSNSDESNQVRNLNNFEDDVDSPFYQLSSSTERLEIFDGRFSDYETIQRLNGMGKFCKMSFAGLANK